MEVNNTAKNPIKMWVTDIEEGAMKQARNIANLPFTFKWVSLMPDCHQGFGMPIGGVLATKDVIIPNAVGVDIGCGMIAVKTNFNGELTRDQITQIMGGIRRSVPVGFKKHETPCRDDEMPRAGLAFCGGNKIVEREYSNACLSLGTLGGGNHFIELQRDEEDYLWIMIHSGSRNLGKQVCDYYNKKAKELNRKWHTGIPENHDLAFLPLDSEEGKDYLAEMNYCLEFAQANRNKMMNAVKKCISTEIDCEFDEPINIHHNYANMENHLGHNVMVHRKGATSAQEGQLGIIPGSQGTYSYIVRGKGNVESFKSCSHGAGRKMGRNDAKRNLNLADEIKKLDDIGVVHGIRNISDLDEAAGAYKDIDEVMANQKDLAEIVTKLRPIAVVKG